MPDEPGQVSQPEDDLLYDPEPKMVIPSMLDIVSYCKVSPEGIMGGPSSSDLNRICKGITTPVRKAALVGESKLLLIYCDAAGNEVTRRIRLGSKLKHVFYIYDRDNMLDHLYDRLIEWD